MARYIMLYKGEATDMSTMTPEEINAEMGLWAAWMGRIGPAMVEMGNPFGPGTSVVDDGSERSATPLTGYSIVEADSLEAAKGLAEGHPYLREGKGNYAVDVFELIPAPSPN